ncbi:hypothetical protein ABZP36_026129 [Zizania latifolia]
MSAATGVVAETKICSAAEALVKLGEEAPEQALGVSPEEAVGVPPEAVGVPPEEAVGVPPEVAVGDYPEVALGESQEAAGTKSLEEERMSLTATRAEALKKVAVQQTAD